MSADLPQLRLLFPNYDGVVVDLHAQESLRVGDLKKTILLDHWREDLDSPEDVGKLRLFQSGRELQDHLSLKENNVPFNAVHPTAMHVFIVHKTRMKKAEALRSTTMCMCCIS
eukprot:GHVS01012406.1.p1 GENE.GHVS01012406.1~~GHVS01012406.1.p1  ORF type:complete len:113 (-),score=20.82 GHVS01012406.1:384-722(-)